MRARLWIDECGAQQPAGFNTALDRSLENARHQLWYPSFVCYTEHLTRHDQGVSHAKWPKDNYEFSPTQTGSVVCCPLEAVDIECRPPRAEGLSNRAKKL
jgi:hypothetical protein